MKLAASIRYGGELVSASEVDYEAYRHLGLICPHCNDPVFLAAAHERHLATGVTAKIPAQFRHFKASDPVLVKICSARVEQYDQKEIARRATVARNQRLKLLQRWFWNIMTDRGTGITSYLDDPNNATDRHMTQRVIVGLVREKFATRCNEDAPMTLRIILDSPIDKLQVAGEKLIKDLYRLTQVDLRLHLAICSEVFIFLQARSTAYIFDQLIIASAGLTYYSDAGERALGQGVDISELAYLKLVGLIAIIPWADEFAAYEKASKPALQLQR